MESLLSLCACIGTMNRGERPGLRQTGSRRYSAARASRNPTLVGTRSTASLIGSENGDAMERVPTGLPLRSHKNSSRNVSISTDTDRVELCATVRRLMERTFVLEGLDCVIGARMPANQLRCDPFMAARHSGGPLLDTATTRNSKPRTERRIHAAEATCVSFS